MRKRLLVTGGAGFIGSAFIRYGMQQQIEKIVNLDLLTYAANTASLAAVENDSRYLFVQGDICDEALVEAICREQQIDAIVHFAAESHVDRSITGPKAFFETNVRGTLSLLEVVRKLPHLHFHHVSTDEVYGSLGESGTFSETTPYAPNSPYSASKAASDHFVRAYAHTYGLSTTLSHCTNNYGPYQHEEKLIPLMIASCLNEKPLPIYGTGLNIRDWLYVDDHVEALWLILQKAKKGALYTIGGGCEKTNLDVVHTIINLIAAGEDGEKYRRLITFVPDRLGHDYRYAIDFSKIKRELSWSPKHSFDAGMRKTVAWFLEQFRINSSAYDSK
jgi:dTDP-glucose 4,6-dehydratase